MRTILIPAPEFNGRPEIIIRRAIEDYLIKNNKTYVLIKLPIKNPVKQVYDFNYMLKYNNILFNKLKKVVREGDNLLWIEGWNVLLPKFLWFLEVKKLKVKNYGIFHSSCYIKSDYLSERMCGLQDFLVDSYDKVFVATKYLKEKLGNNKNIKITGLPYINNFSKKVKKKKQVLFNHRWEKDKNYNLFLRLSERVKEYSFIVTTPVKSLYKELSKINSIKVVYTKNKKIYYKVLAESEYLFSWADLETFGYSVLEGYLNGCKLLLNRHLVYRELYNIDGFTHLEKMEEVLKNNNYISKIKFKDIYKYATRNMVKEMEE